MKNLTSTFKIVFIVCIALFLLGLIVSCIFGINTFATLGNGQQLVYQVNGEKDDYSTEINAVKSFLKENGAKVVLVQTSYNAFDKVDSLIFTFKANENLDANVVVSGNQCQVSDINSKQATRTVGVAAIALGVALVLVFGYMALRHLKNNWMAYSLGCVCTILLNCLAIFGIVQLAGLFGYQFDASIVGTFMFVMILTVVTFILTTSFARYSVDFKKVSMFDGLQSANKTLGVYYWIFAIVVAVVAVVLSIIFGGAFAIKLVPIAVASLVCALTAVTVAPALWYLFSNKEEQTNTGK